MWDPSAFVAADYQPSWMEPAVGSVTYLAVVWALKQRSGPALSLTPFVVVHNIILVALSVALTVGGALALKGRYDAEGFDGIFCSQRAQANVLDGAAGYWMKIYYLSKYYELIDTVLLCLKKKETIPLHIYHHCIMVWLCWSWCRYGWLEGSLWCVIVNGIIHTFMYYYYLVAALGQSVWWKKYLTSAQIFQFCTGMIYTNIYLWNDYIRATNGRGGCGASERRYAALAASTVNVSFIALFAMFYRKSYSKPGKKKGQ